MAFVANARPKQARQAGLTVKLPKTYRTRILVRRTRESGENPGHGKNLLFRKERGWVRKVAVFLKDCFRAEESARGENRSLEELSWLGEKAETMRLWEENSPYMNG